MAREEQDYKNFCDCVEEAMKRLCHIWRGHKPQDGIIVQSVGFDGKMGHFSGVYDKCNFYGCLIKHDYGTAIGIDATDILNGATINSSIKSGALSDVVKRAVGNLREYERLEKQRNEEVARMLAERRGHDAEESL